MTSFNVLYRTRQFWNAIWVQPTPQKLELARSVLSSDQYNLFLQMQPGEQNHSLEILQKLMEQGESHPDLWTAALLHDVGKSRIPLHLWERVWIVIGKALFPKHAKAWGSELVGNSDSRKRLHLSRMIHQPFIVSERHPEWGAEMAAEVGTSRLAITLIRRHQERVNQQISSSERSLEDVLLTKLQSVDNES